MTCTNIFDSDRPLDLILIGRVALDFNPIEINCTLAESATFKKYIGGSPANIAVGLSRLGKKAGFIARVSEDSFGDYAIDYFKNEGIDTSHMFRCEDHQVFSHFQLHVTMESQQLLFEHPVEHRAHLPL